MCDPLSAIALAGSAVAAGVSYEGQQETVSAQNQSNDQWVATQRAAAAKAAAADEVQRQKATASLNTAETALSPQNQTAVQQGAATDLNSQMLAGSPAASNSNIQLLGGTPADTSVSQDMASRVTNAAREAQGRIAALAGITSYGGGYEGMGSSAASALSRFGGGDQSRQRPAQRRHQDARDHAGRFSQCNMRKAQTSPARSPASWAISPAAPSRRAAPAKA